MAMPSGGTQAELRHLVSDAQELHERLRRVSIALSITEDMIAEAYERIADVHRDDGGQERLHARLARMTAQECRQFAKRLDELHDS